MRSKQYTIPDAIRTDTPEELFDFLAKCLRDFTVINKLDGEKLRLGFSFGFPCEHRTIRSATLLRWAKEINVSGVIGADVVALLENAISKIPDLKVEVCALINNSTGTLLSCAWKVQTCKIGCVLEWGTNISYVEDVKNIPKYEGDTSKSLMVINTESGNFGSNGKIDFVRTGWDVDLDTDTFHPGTNICEKMVAASYIGEVVRRVLVTAIQRNIILKGKMTHQMATINSLTVANLVEIGKDITGHRAAHNVCNQLGYTTVCTQDCVDLEYVCQTVCNRAGYLVAASIAAVVNYLRYKEVAVGMDGHFFHGFPGMPEVIQNKINDLKSNQIKLQYVLADDRGGLGAALAASIPAEQPTEEELFAQGSFARSASFISRGTISSKSLQSTKSAEMSTASMRKKNLRKSNAELKVIKAPPKGQVRNSDLYSHSTSNVRSSPSQTKNLKRGTSHSVVNDSKSSSNVPDHKTPTTERSNRNMHNSEYNLRQSRSTASYMVKKDGRPMSMSRLPSPTPSLTGKKSDMYYNSRASRVGQIPPKPRKSDVSSANVREQAINKTAQQRSRASLGHSIVSLSNARSSVFILREKKSLTDKRDSMPSASRASKKISVLSTRPSTTFQGPKKYGAGTSSSKNEIISKSSPRTSNAHEARTNRKSELPTGNAMQTSEKGQRVSQTNKTHTNDVAARKSQAGVKTTKRTPSVTSASEQKPKGTDSTVSLHSKTEIGAKKSTQNIRRNTKMVEEKEDASLEEMKENRKKSVMQPKRERSSVGLNSQPNQSVKTVKKTPQNTAAKEALNEPRRMESNIDTQKRPKKSIQSAKQEKIDGDSLTGNTESRKSRSNIKQSQHDLTDASMKREIKRESASGSPKTNKASPQNEISSPTDAPEDKATAPKKTKTGKQQTKQSVSTSEGESSVSEQ